LGWRRDPGSVLDTPQLVNLTCLSPSNGRVGKKCEIYTENEKKAMSLTGKLSSPVRTDGAGYFVLKIILLNTI